VENFPLLDIVIGLSLIYTCVSLLASELTDFVLTTSQWRTKRPTQCLLTLLGESSSHNPALFKHTITSKLLNSSSLLSITQFKNQHKRSLFLSRNAPHLLAAALLEVLQNLPESQALMKDHRVVSASSIDVLQSIVTSSPDLSQMLRTNLTQLICRVKILEPDPHHQMERLQAEIAIWFSHAIVDVKRQYKHHLKLISFLVSLALTLALNIDSLYIIRRISENTATRAMIVQNVTHIHGCQGKLNSPQCTERLSLLMESTTIPVGWQSSNRQKQFAEFNKITLLRTIGGWFLTSIAIAMGSRFWLRLLRQMAIVLGRGRKPQWVLQSIVTNRDRRSVTQAIELQE
jgi:hypothetical protein